MTTADAITYPLIGPHFPETGPVGVMVASQRDLRLLCRLLDFNQQNYYPLYMSRLYTGSVEGRRFAIAGPLVGAPYGAMILETLIAAGVAKIVLWGWCGAISDKVKIGDIIVPGGAVSEEGTSALYGADPAEPAKPASDITAAIKSTLRRHRLEFHEGMVWTTDAIFQETRVKVKQFQSLGVMAVEMETSALFTISRYRGVKTGALLVVSDELSTFTWKPGWKDQRFSQSRRQACNVIGALCQNL